MRLISWLAAGLIVYGFLFAFAAISLAPAGWWVKAAEAQGVADYQAAFAAVFGQGLWTIAGSLVAFILGQLIDGWTRENADLARNRSCSRRMIACATA